MYIVSTVVIIVFGLTSTRSQTPTDSPSPIPSVNPSFSPTSHPSNPTNAPSPKPTYSPNYLNAVTLTYDPLSKPWGHLSFDPKNFHCAYYPRNCNNLLDEIGCVQGSRSVGGCRDGHNLYNFSTTCKCNGDPVKLDLSGPTGDDLVDNRIKAEVGWMLEPWATGPPFSISASCEHAKSI